MEALDQVGLLMYITYAIRSNLSLRYMPYAIRQIPYAIRSIRIQP